MLWERSEQSVWGYTLPLAPLAAEPIALAGVRGRSAPIGRTITVPVRGR